MFAQVSLIAALALAPWTRGLLLQIPQDWASSSNVNVSWTNTASDVTFALQLFNTDAFHDTFSIANNLNPSADFAAFQLGVIPAGTYTLRAISPTNASNIFDETPSFQVAGPPASSSTSSSASATSSGSASGSSTGASASATVTSPSGSSSSGFGHTVTGSSTVSASGSATDSTSGSGTSSSSGSSPSNFNNGAASLPPLAPWMAVALGAVAGAAAVL